MVKFDILVFDSKISLTCMCKLFMLKIFNDRFDPEYKVFSG